MTAADVDGVLEMLREFALFEKLDQHLRIDPEKLTLAAFGPDPVVRGLVAETGGGELAGYALFYPIFSSFSGERGLYLEDLYVRPQHRGGGLGRRFLGALALEAANLNCTRIDFQVLEWNTPAIEFYRSLGGEMVSDERHFKFAETSVRKLAESA